MKVCVLASGSKGNCTYIESGASKILIDCGIAKKKVVEELASIGVNPAELNAIFVTHEHSDHIKGLGAMSRAFNIPLFVHTDVAQEILEKIGDVSVANYNDFFERDFFFRDLTISPFAVPHDSINCMGFSFYSNGEKVTVTTDLGEVSDSTLQKIQGSKLVVIESNHDVEMLKSNPNYPAELKKRILSGHGHLSNELCAKAIHELAKTGTKEFILAHLSEDNNSAELALQTSSKILLAETLKPNVDFEIQTASQNHRTKLFE